MSTRGHDLPGFLLYPGDFLPDRTFRQLTYEERGLLVTMLMEFWQSGPLPANPERLAALFGLSVVDFERMSAGWLDAFFEWDTENQTLISGDLVRQRERALKLHAARVRGGEIAQRKREKSARAKRSKISTDGDSELPAKPVRKRVSAG